MSTFHRRNNDTAVCTTSHNPTLPSGESLPHSIVQPSSQPLFRTSHDFASRPRWETLPTTKFGTSPGREDTVHTSTTGGRTIIMPQPVNPSLNCYLAPARDYAALGNTVQRSSQLPGLSANTMSFNVEQNETLNGDKMVERPVEATTNPRTNLKGHTIPINHIRTVDIKDEDWEIIEPDTAGTKVAEDPRNYHCRTIHPNGFDAKPARGKDVHGHQYDDTILSNGPELSATDTIVDNSKCTKDESANISLLQDEIDRLEEQKESLKRCFYGMEKQSQEWEHKYHEEQRISKILREYENNSRLGFMDTINKLESSKKRFVRALESKDQELAERSSTIRRLSNRLEKVERVNHDLRGRNKDLERQLLGTLAKKSVLTRKVEDLAYLLKIRERDAYFDNLTIGAQKSIIEKQQELLSRMGSNQR